MSAFLTSSDAFVWSIGADPRLRPTIVTLTLLDGSPDWTALVERFAALADAVPAFRQRIVPTPGLLPPRWVDDPDFDLSFHMRRINAPDPATLDTVLEMARWAAITEFDRARPLWTVTMIDGLADGQAALLCALHHAISDGGGAVALAEHIFDDAAQHPIDPTVRSGGPRSRLGQVIGPVTHPLHTLSTACSVGASVVRTARPTGGPRSPIMLGRTKSRRVAVHCVPQADLRCAGHTAGGSLNDAFLAAVAGALREYHHRHHARLDEALVMMPISIRSAADAEGGNRTMLMRFDLPVGGPPASRIRAIHQQTSRARAEDAVLHAPLVAAMLNMAPRWYVASTLRTVDVIASDVRGIPAPVSLTGAGVTMQYAFSPTMGAAFNITLLTYAGQCALGVNVDTGAIPDFSVFYDCLVTAFDEVLSLGRPPHAR